jgi:SAM-dependent methyltransferase
MTAVRDNAGMTSDALERRGLWSRYWATGMAHSCGTSYDSTYGGAIGDFWRDAFATLAADDRVLDIATGNGALPRLLLSLRPHASVEIDAVDIAQVAPAWILQLDPAQRQRVRIHSGVSAESLPFADDRFALVVSQYGIEYADLSRAIPEALRVLTPGGRVRFLMHHALARPVVLAGHEIEHLDWLLQPGGLADLAAAMIEPMVRATTAEGRTSLAADAAANQLRQRFNEVQAALKARLQTAACPDVLHEVRDWIARMFAMAPTGGLAGCTQALDQIRDALVDSRQRLLDLRLHALDEAAVQQCCERLGQTGLRTSATPLSDQGHLLAWAVCGDPGS